MAFGARLQAAKPPARASVVAGAKFRPQSKIGKEPVIIPSGVTVSVDGSTVTVKGPKGELTKQFNHLVNISVEDQLVKVARTVDSKKSSMMHGTTRAITHNMIQGCAEGYVRNLELRGVGYRAAVEGQQLTLQLGYNQPVVMQIPEGITATVTRNTALKLEGHDNELLGIIAAKIRGKRPPEPYKGKGVRYLGEHVRQKAGKSG